MESVSISKKEILYSPPKKQTHELMNILKNPLPAVFPRDNTNSTTQLLLRKNGLHATISINEQSAIFCRIHSCLPHSCPLPQADTAQRPTNTFIRPILQVPKTSLKHCGQTPEYVRFLKSLIPLLDGIE